MFPIQIAQVDPNEATRYPNGQRKLAQNVFMQTTWGLLALTALGQLFLLVWLDLMS